MTVLKIIAAVFAGIVIILGGVLVATIVLAFTEARDVHKEGRL